MAAAVGLSAANFAVVGVIKTQDESMCSLVVKASGCTMANVDVNVPARFCSGATHHACAAWRRSRLTSTTYVAQVLDARAFVGFLTDQLSENGLFVTSQGLLCSVVSFTPGELPAGVAGLASSMDAVAATSTEQGARAAPSALADREVVAARAGAARGGAVSASTPRSEVVKIGAAGMPGIVKSKHHWMILTGAIGLLLAGSARWVRSKERRHVAGLGYEVLPAIEQFEFDEVKEMQFAIDNRGPV